MANDGGSPENVSRGRGRPLGQLQPVDLQRKYRGQRKFSVAEIKEALQRNHGNSYMAANALNEAEKERGGARTIDRRAVAYHVKKRPELRTLAEEGREEICDVAEQSIVRAIHEGNVALAMRYLEAHGKNRGYARPVEPVYALMKLDFKKLPIEQFKDVFQPPKFTPEQYTVLLDPDKMTDEQINALLRMWTERLGFEIADEFPRDVNTLREQMWVRYFSGDDRLEGQH